jgi:potassium/hydrogen antiporter
MDKETLRIMMISGLVLLISVFTSKATSRFGFPILLIFIGLGMLLGVEGYGGIFFSDHVTAHTLGTVSLIFILFSGGLGSSPRVIRPILKEGVILSSLGVLLSTVFLTCLIHFTLGWRWIVCGLLSAAVASTDAPAVFEMLKMKKISMGKRLKALIEFESGSNDPMALLILILLIRFLMEPGEFVASDIFPTFFIQVTLGGILGWLLGKGMAKLINFLNFDSEGLYSVMTLAGVVCIYSVTEYLGGNGFLSVYVAGFTMAGEKFLSKKSLSAFHDGLSWLMQVAMFLLLGILVVPSHLPSIMEYSFLLAGGLILIARPLSVALCLLPFKYSWKEILLVSSGGMKGAVPIIFATYLRVNNVPHAEIMFNIIFFIVIISMISQGVLMKVLVKQLRLQPQEEPEHISEYERERKSNEFIEFEISPNSKLIGSTIFDLRLPEDVMVVLIHRNDDDFIPKESTELKPLDRLVCLVNKQVIPEIIGLLRSSQGMKAKF